MELYISPRSAHAAAKRRLKGRSYTVVVIHRRNADHSVDVGYAVRVGP